MHGSLSVIVLFITVPKMKKRVLVIEAGWWVGGKQGTLKIIFSKILGKYQEVVFLDDMIFYFKFLNEYPQWFL